MPPPSRSSSSGHQYSVSSLNATADDDEHDEVRHAQPRRPRQALDRPVGDQPAADGERDELPEVRQQRVRRRRSRTGEKEATTVLTIAWRPIARIASPAPSISSSACRGSLAAQDERDQDQAERDQQQQPARGGEAAGLEHPLERAEDRDGRGDRGEQQADRRALAQRGVERDAGHDRRGPGELARREAVLGQVGAEHVGEPDQRREQQQQPGDEQHRLVRRRLPALVRRLQPEREDHARGHGEDDQVDAERDLVGEPQLLEREPGRRAPPRRRRSAVHDAAAGEGVRARRAETWCATGGGPRCVPLARGRPRPAAGRRRGRG